MYGVSVLLVNAGAGVEREPTPRPRSLCKDPVTCGILLPHGREFHMDTYVYQAPYMTRRDPEAYLVCGQGDAGSASRQEPLRLLGLGRWTVSLLGVVLLLSVLLLGCAQDTGSETEQAAPVERSLMDPATLNETAPEQFIARFETSKGVVRFEVTRSSAPIGVDRFYNLVKNGYYNGSRFFRVLPNYVGFGLSGDPAIDAVWREQEMQDDPVTRTNRKGTIVFTPLERPNSRTTYLSINTAANGYLDSSGYAPFGMIIEGMEVIESLYDGYGQDPDIAMILEQGNEYLTKQFPRMDYIETATIE